METKVCKVCGIEKPILHFHIACYNKDKTKIYRKPSCNVCFNKKNREVYHPNYKENCPEKYAAKRLKDLLENAGANRAERRALESRAKINWSNKKKIKAIYKECAKLNNEAGYIKYHVHHIVPLNSKYVCGLHHELNLAIITWEENLKLGNRSWPDMCDIDDELVEMAKKFLEEFPKFDKARIRREKKQEKKNKGLPNQIIPEVKLSVQNKTYDISEDVLGLFLQPLSIFEYHYCGEDQPFSL